MYFYFKKWNILDSIFLPPLTWKYLRAQRFGHKYMSHLCFCHQMWNMSQLNTLRYARHFLFFRVWKFLQSNIFRCVFTFVCLLSYVNHVLAKRSLTTEVSRTVFSDSEDFSVKHVSTCITFVFLLSNVKHVEWYFSVSSNVGVFAVRHFSTFVTFVFLLSNVKYVGLYLCVSSEGCTYSKRHQRVQMCV